MKSGRIILAAFLLSLLISAGGAASADYYGVENFGIMSDGQMIGSLNGQETVNAFVQFTNHENAFDSIIFLAVYKDGRLIDLEITRVANHAGEDIIVSEPVDVTEKGITVKAILLYDTETLEPRGPAVELGEGVRLQSSQVLDVTELDNTVTVSYQENEADTNMKTIQFSADADCYVNNVRYYSAPWDNLLWQYYGTLEIVKADENRKTDSVYITTYKNLCVDTVDTEHKRITGKNTSKQVFYGEDAVLYGSDGKKMDWEALREWDILTYTEAEGLGGKFYCRAWLIQHSITGTVEAIENEGTRDVRYTINGQAYGIDNIMDCSDGFLIGETGTFYLDKLGNIAWHDTVVPYIVPYKVNYSYIDEAVYYEGDTPPCSSKYLRKKDAWNPIC